MVEPVLADKGRRNRRFEMELPWKKIEGLNRERAKRGRTMAFLAAGKHHRRWGSANQDPRQAVLKPHPERSSRSYLFSSSSHLSLI